MKTWKDYAIKLFCYKEAPYTNITYESLITYYKADKAKPKRTNKQLFETNIKTLLDTDMVDGLQAYRAFQAKVFYDTHCKGEYRADNMRGIYIYGEPRVGKSHYARHHFGLHPFLKQTDQWWGGYCGQEVVLMEDLTEVCDKEMFTNIKKWADIWPVDGMVKGNAQIHLRHKFFIMTSNYPIEDVFEKSLPGYENKTSKTY